MNAENDTKKRSVFTSVSPSQERIIVGVTIASSTTATVISMWELFLLSKNPSSQLLYCLLIIIYVTLLGNLVYIKNEAMLYVSNCVNNRMANVGDAMIPEERTFKFSLQKESLRRILELGIERVCGWKYELENVNSDPPNTFRKAEITPILALNGNEYALTKLALISFGAQLPNPNASSMRLVKVNTEDDAIVDKDVTDENDPSRPMFTKETLNKMELINVVDVKTDEGVGISSQHNEGKLDNYGKLPVPANDFPEDASSSHDTMEMNHGTGKGLLLHYANDPTYDPKTEIETPVTRITYKTDLSGQTLIGLNRQIIKMPKQADESTEKSLTAESLSSWQSSTLMPSDLPLKKSTSYVNHFLSLKP